MVVSRWPKKTHFTAAEALANDQSRRLTTVFYPAFSMTVANEALRFSTISRVTSNSFTFF